MATEPLVYAASAVISKAEKLEPESFPGDEAADKESA
jgi:hypothetical protein